MTSKFRKMTLKLDKGLKDMETFVEGMSQTGFVYRYGFNMSHTRESTLVAWCHSDTESGINHKIRIMNSKFQKYTTTRSDKEFVKSENTWYCTYVVDYPFVKGDSGDINDHQGFKPLF